MTRQLASFCLVWEVASYTVTGVAGLPHPQTFDKMMGDRKYLVSVVLSFLSLVKPNARGEPPRPGRRPPATKLPLARSAPLLCSARGRAQEYGVARPLTRLLSALWYAYAASVEGTCFKYARISALTRSISAR